MWNLCLIAQAEKRRDTECLLGVALFSFLLATRWASSFQNVGWDCRHMSSWLKCLFPVIQAFAKLCDRPFVSYKLLRAQKRFANFIVLVLIPLLVSSHPDTWAGLLPRLRTAQASYRSPRANTNRTPFQKTSIISSKDHPGNRCQRADICSKTAVAPQHLVSSMHALSFQPVWRDFLRKWDW